MTKQITLYFAAEWTLDARMPSHCCYTEEDLEVLGVETAAAALERLKANPPAEDAGPEERRAHAVEMEWLATLDPQDAVKNGALCDDVWHYTADLAGWRLWIAEGLADRGAGRAEYRRRLARAAARVLEVELALAAKEDGDE